MNKKRYCIRNHDTWLYGRDKERHCNMCEKERKERFHEARISNPIKRMIKNAKQRIRYREKLLKDK